MSDLARALGLGERRADPAADAREARVARAITIVATVWFALVASWEMLGPILAGHYASSASVGIIADNMRRWHIWGPVWTYTSSKPSPALYYCHHPWGIFWVERLFFAVFGRHDFVCRLPPILLSAATPPLLAKTARALYRPYAGAAAAVAFVVLPITLSFANFNALEVPVIAWSTLMLWGYLELRARPRRRWLVATVIGAAMAASADWPAFVLVGSLLAVDLGSMLASRRRSLERRRVLAWAFVVVAATAVLGYHVAAFQAAGKLGDLLASYSMRSAGNEASLADVLRSRRYWIELMFTPIAIALGKVFVPVAVLRFALSRRATELVPLLVLLMATVQYVVFKQGADIHVFWPHYFAQYFALAAGGLVATLAPGFEALIARRSETRRTLGAPVALGLVLFACAFVLRDGVPAVAYARATGGRFNEKGLRIESEGDRIALYRWMAPRYESISLHADMNAGWNDLWAFGGREIPFFGTPPPPGSGAVTVADARFLPDAVRATWIQSYGVVVAGPYWIIESTPHPPRALAFAEREPSPIEWLSVSATEPVRSIVDDPWETWELRTHYGLDPGPLPDGPPIPGPIGALEMHRIAHNAAVAAGDDGKASAELAAMDRECAATPGADFQDGTRIRCVAFHDGASPTLTVVFEPSGPFDGGVEMRIASRVVRSALLSATMPDPVVKEHAFPFALAPSRFRKGFVYSLVARVRKRPGREVFDATFRGPRAPGREHAVRILDWP